MTIQFGRMLSLLKSTDAVKVADEIAVINAIKLKTADAIRATNL